MMKARALSELATHPTRHYGEATEAVRGLVADVEKEELEEEGGAGHPRAEAHHVNVTSFTLE